MNDSLKSRCCWHCLLNGTCENAGCSAVKSNRTCYVGDGNCETCKDFKPESQTD